jgi:hypothetical protein
MKSCDPSLFRLKFAPGFEFDLGLSVVRDRTFFSPQVNCLPANVDCIRHVLDAAIIFECLFKVHHLLLIDTQVNEHYVGCQVILQRK